MVHLAGLEHNIRQKGIGDRVAWGKWCYVELEKERSGRREVKLEGARMWCANFLIRRGQSNSFLGEWFDNDSIPGEAATNDANSSWQLSVRGVGT